MKYKDPVQVLRDAITSATGAKTVRVIQEGSLPDTWPMPLVHVYATQSQDLDFERITSVVVDVYAKTPQGRASSARRRSRMRLWMLCQFVLWWGLLGGWMRFLCRPAWGCAPHTASLRWWASAWKSLNVPPTNQI